jgi:RHS repeat-associated protein
LVLRSAEIFLTVQNHSEKFSRKWKPVKHRKQVDSDTGLYYFNARWYDAELGRFVTEDPARDGRNWYEYCGNNPLKYTDTDGKTYGAAAKKIVLATSEIVGGLILAGGTAGVGAAVGVGLVLDGIG